MNLRYLLTGVIRRHLPLPLLFVIMRLRGDGNGAEKNPDPIMNELTARLAHYDISISDKHILELGSGRYARLALRMLAQGARHVTLVDFYALPLDNPQHQHILHTDCAQLGLDFADACKRITVMNTDFLATVAPPDLDKPDYITSLAVLEHVRDPATILQKCYEWLRPGGQTFHVVDLRDHNLQFQYPFEMLAYSDSFWERWLNQPGGFHLNRWRAPDYAEAVRQAGFQMIKCRTTITDVEGLQKLLWRIHPQFHRYNTAQLAVQGIELWGVKPL